MADYLRKYGNEMPDRARELLAAWKRREITESDLYLHGGPLDNNAPGFRRCMKCGKPFWSTHAGNRYHVRCLQVKRDALGFPLIPWMPPVVRGQGIQAENQQPDELEIMDRRSLVAETRLADLRESLVEA